MGRKENRRALRLPGPDATTDGEHPKYTRRYPRCQPCWTAKTPGLSTRGLVADRARLLQQVHPSPIPSRGLLTGPIRSRWPAPGTTPEAEPAHPYGCRRMGLAGDGERISGRERGVKRSTREHAGGYHRSSRYPHHPQMVHPGGWIHPTIDPFGWHSAQR